MHQPNAHCVSCGTVVHDRFCPHCGEKRLDAHDLTLVHFAEHTIEAFTHADGKIFRTLRNLFVRPGELTVDYITGRRRGSLGPLQLFLICNVIYFLAQPLLGWDSLSSTLYTNVRLSFFKAVAQSMVQAKLAGSKLAFSDYAEKFNHAAVLNGKSLVILLVPLFAIVFAGIFWRHRRPLVLHLALALHFTAFFLLGLLAMHGWLNLLQWLFTALGHPLSVDVLDNGSGFSLLALFGLYLAAAFHRVYGVAGRGRVWTALAATALILPVVTVYRFVLFLVTLAAT